MNDNEPSQELQQQIEQAKQELTDQPAVTGIQVMPQAAPPTVQSATLSSSKKQKPVFAIISIVIIIAAISIGSISWRLVGAHRNAGQVSGSTFVAPSMGTPIARPTYRLYQDFSGIKDATSKLSLVDQGGNVVSTNSTSLPLDLKTQLGNRSLLVEDDFYASIKNNNPDDYGGHYWLIDNTGKLTPTIKAVDSILRTGAGSQNSVGILYPVSDNEVLYYQCKDYVAQSCGTLHRLNIITGANQTYEVGYGELRGVSPDGKIAYLLGWGRTSMQLISYSLQDKKTLSRNDLPVLSKNERQFWVSPKGDFVAYANEGTSMIKIVSIQNHKTVQIQTPKSWELNSWSGEVTLPSPKWSPDEQSILFVAWTIDSQYLAVANIDTKAYQTIDTLDKSHDASDSEYGPGLNHHNFGSIGWLSNNSFDFGSTNNEGAGTIGKVLANKTSDLAGQQILIPINYGTLLETNDGHPAL